MKKLGLTLILLISAHILFAQGELEKRLDGIKYKETVFVEFNKTTGKLKYKTNTDDLIYKELSDSTLFLFAGQGSTVVFATPLNPLAYNIKTKTILREDKLIVDLNNALGAIAQQFGAIYQLQSMGDPNNKMKDYPLSFLTETLNSGCIQLDTSELGDVKALDSLVYSPFLSDSIIKVKERLTKLEFINKENSDKHLSNIHKDIAYISEQSEKIDKLYEEIKSKLTTTIESCTDEDKSFIIAMMSSSYLHNTYLIKHERNKALEALKEMEKTANTYAEKLVDIDGSNYERIAEFKVQRGKVHDITYNVTYKEDGEDKKAGKTMSFTHYRSLLWEVTPGVAYTNVIYDTYGISTDADGVTTVAEAGEEHIKQANINLMLNANIIIPGWHETMPFFQIGAGPSKDYPMLFAGGGIRINDRFRVSTGAVFTWVKELNDLKVGDPVDGTAALEKDLSYTFTGPKIYVGLQIGLK